MSLLGLLVLVVVLALIFRGGTDTAYFWPGSIVGTVLFLVLLLWVLGVIGGRTHFGW